MEMLTEDGFTKVNNYGRSVTAVIKTKKGEVYEVEGRIVTKIITIRKPLKKTIGTHKQKEKRLRKKSKRKESYFITNAKGKERKSFGGGTKIQILMHPKYELDFMQNMGHL